MYEEPWPLCYLCGAAPRRFSTHVATGTKYCIIDDTHEFRVIREASCSSWRNMTPIARRIGLSRKVGVKAKVQSPVAATVPSDPWERRRARLLYRTRRNVLHRVSARVAFPKGIRNCPTVRVSRG